MLWLTVKDVKSIMSDGLEPSTDSAVSAPPKYLLGLENVVPESLKKKCSKCESVTMHQWLKVGPSPVGTLEDPLELLSLQKRIVMCQQCGTISVTK